MIQRLMAGLGARLRALRGERFETEMDEELRFHLDEATRRNVERGMDPDAACRAARRQFGGMGAVEETKEEVRHETGVRIFRDAARDLRHAGRGIRRHPAFAVVAAITLALGIGANTAVFSAVDTVLLSPLPYPEPDRLVKLLTIWEGDPEGASVLSGLDFLDFRQEVEAFETLAALFTYQEQGVDLMGPDGPVRLRALPIGAGYFETYRATPALGRTFTRDEEASDAYVTILSDRAWKAITNADPNVIGRPLTLDGLPYTVIGVMRPSFMDVDAGDVDLWIPQDLQPGGFNSRENMYLAAIGRLAPGADIAQAQARIDAVAASIQEEDRGRRTRVVPLIDEVVEGAGTMLYILLGASGLVLLIACVNVANLALARGTARQGELAVRLAVGSGRGRLVRQLVTESLVIAAIGGIAGLGLATGGLRVLLALGPETLPRAEEIGFDGSLLLFTVLITLITGLVFGLVPALGLTRSGLAGAVREDARGAGVGPARTRLRGGLVAAQVALAAMLLFGAGVLMRSFLHLQQVDTGVRTENVATFEVHLPEIRYADAESRVRLHGELNERLSGLSGIEAAGATSWLPLMGQHNQWGLRWSGEGGDGGFAAQVRVIEGAYLEAFGIPLVAGRRFQRTDTADTDPVALMNETAVRMTFGEPDEALNRPIRIGPGEWTVVGVVGDVAHSPRGELGPRIYFPHAQFGSRDWGLSVVLASSTGVGPAISAARRELEAVDSELVLYRPRPFEEVAAAQIARERFAFTLMGAFAAIALLLATVGLYGVLSYVVSQRVREFGIRMALGAQGGQIVGLVARRGALLTAGGLAVGLAGAALLARSLSALTFGIPVTEASVFVLVAGLIGVVSFGAVAVPAWRATRVNPIEALRIE